ncbi:MAG: histone deacetylase family protein, partial [Solirubrobacterales bacterium]
VVAPVARSHRPDLLIISAGFDAHADDPLAQCRLDDDCYAQMTATVRELGAEWEVPVLVCLEGGYDLDALARSVLATVRALGDSLAPAASDPEMAREERERFAPYWPEALG